MHASVGGLTGDPRPHAGRRGLATARAVLHVLSFLEQHPDGVRADDVARVVGKSASTAYYLLASLVEEGYAVHEGGLYKPHHEIAAPPAAASAGDRHVLEDAVDDLFLRTHKRCYLGVVRGGVIEITVVRGRQGIARMPGLGTQITDNAHALAMGKVVLARLRPAALARYVARGLPRYTPSTITTPGALARELRDVRAHGYAAEREEFDLDFCCVAAPVLDERLRLAAILGLSASTRAFDAEHGELAAAVRDLAAEAGAAPFQHRAEKHAFLVAQAGGA
ncbi:MAG: acetyl-CoA synthetase [Solirubrobacteraceae bacterium]|nr:acetyl-CoA synthetase [Solirubrobacteraceae bacterium]